MSRHKALLLLSGGLDSRLAGALLLKQSIRIEAVNFVTPFCRCTPRNRGCSAAKDAARSLGIPVRTVPLTEEYLSILRNPKHGYGSGVNPCIDCRILMFRKAKQMMDETGAEFIVTGEVLNERPMSQRKNIMLLIEKEAGVERLVVRPLSARLLPVTLPEERGWIDRKALYEIRGRSRKEQFRMAESLEIGDYPCPAGGCLLTDPQFARRMRDLMKHKPHFKMRDVQLLKVGRHFRLTEDLKLVVGRNEAENRRIESLKNNGETLLEAVDFTGPLGLMEETEDKRAVKEACAIVAGYGKGRSYGSVRVRVRSTTKDEVLSVKPCKLEDAHRYLL